MASIEKRIGSALTPFQNMAAISNSIIRGITNQNSDTGGKDKEGKGNYPKGRDAIRWLPDSLPATDTTPQGRPEGPRTRQKVRELSAKFRGEGNKNRREGTSGLDWKGTSGP